MNQSSNDTFTVTISIPVGLMAILFATIVPFFMSSTPWAMASYKYIYCAGAALMLIVRLFHPYRGSDMRLRRLHRIEAWVPVIFAVGAFFLFYDQGSLRDWIAFTLAGAALQIFTSIAIPLREYKLIKGQDDKENTRG